MHQYRHILLSILWAGTLGLGFVLTSCRNDGAPIVPSTGMSGSFSAKGSANSFGIDHVTPIIDAKNWDGQADLADEGYQIVPSVN